MESVRQSVSESRRRMSVAVACLVALMLAYNADAASIPDPIIEELVDEQLRDFQVLIKKEIVGHDINETTPYLEEDWILPSTDEARRILNALRSRQKRAFIDHIRWPDYLWPGKTIHYVIAEDFTDAQTRDIRVSMLKWMEKTCLKFQEHSSTDVYLQTNPHLKFTKASSCVSFVGRGENDTPQFVFLHDSCFQQRSGYVSHLVGHALGLFHEHQREDRDDFIEIRKANILEEEEGSFTILPGVATTTMGHFYDYASISHFDPLSFSGNGDNTIVTKNTLYQQTIGQRAEISFLDALKVNNAYCNDDDTCPYEILCANGGYQHPRYCTQCVCPDTFGGHRCMGLAHSIGEPCGGAHSLEVSNPIFINSPSFGYGRYLVNQRCSWSIRAPRGRKIKVSFVGEFGVFSRKDVCYHWVEVRYQANLERTGPRFCGWRRPEVVLKSEGDEVRISFKANYDNENPSDVGIPFGERIGFQARVELVPDHCESAPCYNGATCIDMDGVGFFCRCAPGYTGPTCTVSHCSFDSCHNGGSCISTLTGFRCHCPEHFGGDRCQESLQQCGACGYPGGSGWDVPCIHPTLLETHHYPCQIPAVETTWYGTTSTRYVESACTAERFRRYCCTNAVLHFHRRRTEPVCFPVGWSTWSYCNAPCGGCGLQRRQLHTVFTYGRGLDRFSVSDTSGHQFRPCNFEACTSCSGRGRCRCHVPCCDGLVLDSNGTTCVRPTTSTTSRPATSTAPPLRSFTEIMSSTIRARRNSNRPDPTPTTQRREYTTRPFQIYDSPDSSSDSSET